MRKSVLGFILVTLSLSATAQTTVTDPNDPHEDFNRHMFALNNSLDKAIFKPVATLYQTGLPAFAQKGISHFFSNLDEIPTVFNDVLQGDMHHAGQDSKRFLINSTAGAGGLVDMATEVGIKKHYEDFGLTLAKWGYTQSDYLVLPFWGPSTVRDTIGLPVDYAASIYPYIDRDTSLDLYILNIINARANLLSYQGVFVQAFDPYVFVRNAYLQRREAKIAQNDKDE